MILWLSYSSSTCPLRNLFGKKPPFLLLSLRCHSKKKEGGRQKKEDYRQLLIRLIVPNAKKNKTKTNRFLIIFLSYFIVLLLLCHFFFKFSNLTGLTQLSMYWDKLKCSYNSLNCICQFLFFIFFCKKAEFCVLSVWVCQVGLWCTCEVFSQ